MFNIFLRTQLYRHFLSVICSSSPWSSLLLLVSALGAGSVEVAVGNTTAFVVVLVFFASAVELVAACTVGWATTSVVAWAGDAVSVAEMSAVVGPSAGLPLATVKLKAV